jgi:hypothetical protein
MSDTATHQIGLCTYNELLLSDMLAARKSRRMGWVRHVERMEKMENAYTI